MCGLAFVDSATEIAIIEKVGGVWTSGILTATAPDLALVFRASVAVGGDTILVGAPGEVPVDS